MKCNGIRPRWGATAALAPTLLAAGCDRKTVPPPEPKTGPRIEQPGSAPRSGTTGAVPPDSTATRRIAEAGDKPTP